MRFRLRTLLIMLTVLTPALAWGRSERHDFREREPARQEWKRQAEQIEKWKRQAEQIDKLQRRRSYPYFQLDIY